VMKIERSKFQIRCC